ncbi:MAG: tRNA pseudouridine(55) synthase TruB [Candidatus Ancillula sp.]|jgi:riboflavin kinase/FMN adenylyltransferase/tRNA pseudouridine(55) synthase/tRNA threonylcarbamoyl adenosine modification protein (Sua5/YciO/YrdC/YwlC family)|nr:tRNA pseudouridine(55) synthase TruB [Candidatus Ancillula sp.]
MALENYTNRALNGVFAIDKPTDVGSAAIDYKIKKQLAKILGVSNKKAPKVGHAGTLDPFASGVLIIGVGEGTKELHKLESDEKEYLATVRLGWQTDTDDFTGQIISTVSPVGIDKDKIEKSLAKLRGKIKQKPSSYSAKRIAGTGGKRAYDIMREGGEVELPEVDIEVYELELLEMGDLIQADFFDSEENKHIVECLDIKIKARVSSGTYIRALARDLGANLGVGGHLRSLRRTRVGKIGSRFNWEIQKCQNLNNILTIEDIDGFKNILNPYPNGSVVTLGSFDGVHLGHQKLIKTTVQQAKKIGSKSVVLVIDSGSIVTEESLTTLDYRIKLIKSLGVSEVKVVNLSNIKDLEYTSFLDKLISQIGLREFVMTEEMRFGKNREGEIDSVSNYLSAKDINVKRVDLEQVEDGEKISSSDIRSLIKVGKVDEASKMLGKSYKLSGLVVHGFERGRKIGFPTANLEDIKTIIPAEGVYYGSVSWKDKHEAHREAAMISIGKNPTFSNDSLSVEVNLPKFNTKKNDQNQLNLYDKELNIAFSAKIREMIKFESIEDLKSNLDYCAKLTLAAWSVDRGGVIVFPTDTVFGLGTALSNSSGLDKIYQLKNRERSKKLQRMVGSVKQAVQLGEFGSQEIALAEKFWTDDRKGEISKGGLTIVAGEWAYRMPSNKVALDLLNLTGPMWTTSANPSGDITPKNSREIENYFGSKINYYFDDIFNEISSSNQASTVCEVKDGEVIIYREGKITEKMLKEALR